VELYYGGVEYFSTIYDQMDPSREEVENYYNLHGDEVESTYGVNKESGKLIDVRHVLVSVKTTGTDENGNAVSTEEDWAACLADAQKILDSWKEGAATEESFALLANTFSTDPGSNTTGGLYSYVYEGQMVKNFNDWCFDDARRSGDTGIVQSDFGYHVMYFVQGEEGWLRRSEQMLIEECSHFNDDQMKMFLESDLCQQLITEGKMRKNTIVILSKKDDQARRRKMVAMQMAKDAKDPLWDKLKKNRVIERQLLGKIMKKYGSKADRTAKVQQKDWIKNRMPANFGKFGGDTRISHDAPAK
jgi:hypothetical protein